MFKQVKKPQCMLIIANLFFTFGPKFCNPPVSIHLRFCVKFVFFSGGGIRDISFCINCTRYRTLAL